LGLVLFSTLLESDNTDLGMIESIAQKIGVGPTVVILSLAFGGLFAGLIESQDAGSPTRNKLKGIGEFLKLVPAGIKAWFHYYVLGVGQEKVQEAIEEGEELLGHEKGQVLHEMKQGGNGTIEAAMNLPDEIKVVEQECRTSPTPPSLTPTKVAVEEEQQQQQPQVIQKLREMVRPPPREELVQKGKEILQDMKKGSTGFFQAARNLPNEIKKVEMECRTTNRTAKDRGRSVSLPAMNTVH
jgi:hypothetical protein